MHDLLLVDDDVELTELLAQYLEQHDYRVTAVNYPEDALDVLGSRSFALVLLDIMMPNIDGFSLLASIRQVSKVPVIMLTARGDDYDKIVGLEMGADDYLSKPFNQRELAARIKALIRRTDADGALSDYEVVQVEALQLNKSLMMVSYHDCEIKMTATEFMILLCLARQHRRLLSKETLYQQALGRELTRYDRSLDMHVSNVRKKLGANGIPDAVKTIRGSGYMLCIPGHTAPSK